MIVYVTGARGAIGRHVVRLAKADGHTVAGVGHGAWGSDAGLAPIDEWINGGIIADNLGALLRTCGKPDVVVHLAGGSHVGASIAHPGEDFRRTVESAQELLEWVRNNAADARLVLASSAAVYGDVQDGPIDETAAFAPTSPYGTHKAIMELLARSYARQFSLSISLLRLFSVYGAGMRKQIVWELANRLANGERDILLGGTGEEKRDFVWIEDAARMLLHAADRASPQAPVFNGCSGRATSIRDLTGTIASNWPGARIAFSGVSRQGDPASLVGNPAKAHSDGLAPATPLEAGLSETLRWIAHVRSNGSTS